MNHEIITHTDSRWADFHRTFREMGYRNIARTDSFAEIGQYLALIQPDSTSP
jgi:IS4 transposase